MTTTPTTPTAPTALSTNRAELIARTMATMGYIPKGAVDTRYVEYYKDYAEPHGRVARCTVLFDKGGVFAGFDRSRLAGFVVTVQGTIDPLLEEIKTKAPKVMHPDMVRAISELADGAERAVQAIRTVECTDCGSQTPEWIEGKNGPECPHHAGGDVDA